MSVPAGHPSRRFPVREGGPRVLRPVMRYAGSGGCVALRPMRRVAMVPLDPLVVRSLRSWLGEPAGPGLLALHHALAYQRPGLWGDHARVPQSVILVREG